MRTRRFCTCIAAVTVIALTTIRAEAQTTWFVDDDDLAGVRDGTSWETAFEFLQDGLTAAQAGDTVRIAKGKYHPDDDDDQPGPPGSTHTPGDRDASFVIEVGRIIEGGYIGNNTLGIDPDTQIPSIYETVLSGDLNDDDDLTLGLEQANRQENSRNVVRTDGASILTETKLRGVTIRDGHLTVPFGIFDGGGSGMRIRLDDDLTIEECTFRRNWTSQNG